MDKVDLVNECCTLLMSYFVICYSSFIGDPYLKYELGWYTICLFVANFLFNVSIIVYMTGKMIAKKIRKIKRTCKRKK